MQRYKRRISSKSSLMQVSHHRGLCRGNLTTPLFPLRQWNSTNFTNRAHEPEGLGHINKFFVGFAVVMHVIGWPIWAPSIQ